MLPNGEEYLHGRWMEETIEVAKRCSFSREELRYEYPEQFVPAGETPSSHLRKLANAGAAGRFPAGLPDKVRSQLGARAGDQTVSPRTPTARTMSGSARPVCRRTA